MTPENAKQLKKLQQELKAAEARVADLRGQINSIVEKDQQRLDLLPPKKKLKTNCIPPIAGASFKLVLEFLQLKDVHFCAQVCKQWTDEIDHDIFRQVISNMIYRIAYSEDEEETADALCDLAMSIDHSGGKVVTQKKSQEYAKLIFQLHGIGAIIGSIGRYNDNEYIGQCAFMILYLIQYGNKEASMMMAKFGIPKLAIESACRQYDGEYDKDLNMEVAGLLVNLSDSRKEGARNEFIHFMIWTIIQFPGEMYFKEQGCRYFVNIALLLPTVKETLRERKIGSLVGSAYKRLLDDEPAEFDAYREMIEEFLNYV